jgi:hypothetical protein
MASKISKVGSSPAPVRPRAAWKAGVASIEITPPVGIWMGGFQARTEPSKGIAAPLFAKALALDDGTGESAVLVSVETLGLTGRLANRIADAVRRRHGVRRPRLLLNATHTHCGPVIDELLPVAYELSHDQHALIHAYTLDLEARIVAVIGDALARVEPARLSFGQSEAGFARNRRRDFPGGPVDHAVPVLRVDRVDDTDRVAGSDRREDVGRGEGAGSAAAAAGVEHESGQPLAIVFGYACHTTTLRADFVEFHGDYAGVAQALLQERHPGTTALFMSGCGGDADPIPHGSMTLTEEYGTQLADAVDRVLPSLSLASAPSPLSGPLVATYEIVDLPFETPPDREALLSRLQDEHQYIQRHARLMLETLDRDGRLPAVQPNPIQIWRFGTAAATSAGTAASASAGTNAGMGAAVAPAGARPTVIALGGEAVADYAVRIRADYPEQRDRLWIASYSNDVFGYVPSRRVLNEGGYEADRSTRYYGLPNRFAPAIEDLIHGTIGDVLRSARVMRR